MAQHLSQHIRTIDRYNEQNYYRTTHAAGFDCPVMSVLSTTGKDRCLLWECPQCLEVVDRSDVDFSGVKAMVFWCFLYCSSQKPSRWPFAYPQFICDICTSIWLKVKWTSHPMDSISMDPQVSSALILESSSPSWIKLKISFKVLSTICLDLGRWKKWRRCILGMVTGYRFWSGFWLEHPQSLSYTIVILWMYTYI